MLVLITPEQTIKEEHLLIEQMLSLFPLLRLHIRKPSYGAKQLDNYLQYFRNNDLLNNSVLHGDTSTNFHLLRHARTADRLKNDCSFKFISTSVHNPTDLLTLHPFYTYLFCSPVFSSISKTNYHPKEEWDISSLEAAVRNKAVALSGISYHTLSGIQEKGFQHAALLGAIWENGDPIREMEKITRTFKAVYENKLIS